MDTLILTNANIMTMDEGNPVAEAVAIAQGRICAVGDDAEIRPMAGDKIIDLNRKVVLPGFIDCHTHFLNMGMALAHLNLRGSSSIDEVLERVSERARETEKGSWIVGCGWDESKWKEKRYINRFDLDRATPDNPVVLKRICGHLWVVNTRGLEAAGIPQDEPGLEKDSTGAPTGLLRWGAKNFIWKLVSPARSETMNALKLAVKESLKHGVTSVTELSASVPVFREAANSSDLLVRVYMGMGYESLDALEKIGLSTGFGNDLLKLGPVKMFADGAIGARTAALYEPYDDDPGNSGQLAMTESELYDRIGKAHIAGSQVAVHAIGDRGIDSLLNALRRVLEEHPRGNHRHRIEHAELLTDEQMDQVRELDVILSMQPNFIGEWGGPGELYEKRVGIRYRRMNPIRKVVDKGIRMAFGSDCMPFGPMYGIWSVVNNPVQENRLSVREAIYCYTLGAAYASFEEDLKGSIEVGKLADLVVLSSTDLPGDRLKDIPIEMTILDGRLVYAKGAEPP